MKPNRILIFISLFVACHFAAGQTVTFCKSVSQSGEPVTALKKTELLTDSTTVKILFKQPLPITETVFFFLDREKNGEFVEYATFKKSPVAGRKWVAHDFTLRKTGLYKVRVMDKNISELASSYLEVTGPEEGETAVMNVNPVTDEKPNQAYYASCVITFCEKISNGKPVFPSGSFTIPEEGREISMQVSQEKPLQTEKLIVDFWLKNDKGEYSDFVDTKYYTIEKSWNHPSFKFLFTRPGEYKVMVYNADQTHIVSGKVTIIKP